MTCTSQSQLSAPERAGLVAAAKHFGTLVQAGNVNAVKAETIPSVAAQFGGIASEISAVAPQTTGAALTVVGVYTLDASDLSSAQDQTQFFCGGENSPDVVFSIPQIPPGRYAVTMLHASGVPQPQQISFVLEQRAQEVAGTSATPGATASATTNAAGSAWMLAGLYIRPLLTAGKDGLWYWNKARSFVQAKQNWNAYFYFQTAESLLIPVDFISTPNLDKLIKEQTAIAPAVLPGEKPMTLMTGGHSYSITGLHTDGTLGPLDLVVAYQATDNTDPVAARTRNVELMQALLSQHPELREGFHGLWVYSNVANQRSFANELPMAQIP